MTCRREPWCEEGKAVGVIGGRTGPHVVTAACTCERRSGEERRKDWAGGTRREGGTFATTDRRKTP